MSDSVNPWTAACQTSLSFTSSQSLLKFISNESVILSNHCILCGLLPLPSIFPSIIFFFFPNELVLPVRWSKYWSFGISPSNEYPGLISFRIDLFYLLSVQGNLKSLLQNDSSKPSILQLSAFSMVQQSHLYMSTEKP